MDYAPLGAREATVQTAMQALMGFVRLVIWFVIVLIAYTVAIYIAHAIMRLFDHIWYSVRALVYRARAYFGANE